MENPIHKNVANLEFIETNLIELSKSVGSSTRVNKYYLESFKKEEVTFNFVALFFGPLWFGYRKMYWLSFMIPFVITSMIGVVLPILETLCFGDQCFIDMTQRWNHIMKILVFPSLMSSISRLCLGGICFIDVFQINISIIGIFYCIFFAIFYGLGANSMYFNCLKKRIEGKRESEYGKQLLGIFYGAFLGVLGIISGVLISYFIVWLYYIFMFGRF